MNTEIYADAIISVVLDTPRTQLRDVIASDPPCSKSAAIDALEQDGKGFMPRVACDGGPDGLQLVKPIINKAPQYLKRNGLLSLCLPPWQHVIENVPSHVRASGAYTNPVVLKDGHEQACAVFAHAR